MTIKLFKFFCWMTVVLILGVNFISQEMFLTAVDFAGGISGGVLFMCLGALLSALGYGASIYYK